MIISLLKFCSCNMEMGQTLWNGHFLLNEIGDETLSEYNLMNEYDLSEMKWNLRMV